MTHSYKTILKKVILKLGFGFKKDRIEACLGDEIPLQLDESLFKDNVKRAKKTTKKNSFARWLTGNGSEITDSKTVQDDVGNTVTRVSVNGSLDTIIANDTGSTVHSLQATNGRPINRLLIPNKQLVDNYISDKDYSYNIFLNDIENKGIASVCLRINRKGNFSHQLQYRTLALQTTNLINISGDQTEYYFGSQPGFIIVKDIGGQFYPGDGAGKRAEYSVLEDNTYLFYMHIVIRNENLKNVAELINRVKTNTGREYIGRGVIPVGVGINVCQFLIGIDALAGDKLYFSFTGIVAGKLKQNSILGTPFPTVSCYIGEYCLG